MKSCYLGAITIALIAHATALVIRIELEDNAPDFNNGAANKYHAYKPGHVELDTLTTTGPYHGRNAQPLLNQHSSADRPSLDTNITCGGSVCGTPRVYTMVQAEDAMFLGRSFVRDPLNGFPRLINPSNIPGLDPQCSFQNNVFSYLWPMGTRIVPHPGDALDFVVFGIAQSVPGKPPPPPMPIYCGVVTSTANSGSPTGYQTCTEDS